MIVEALLEARERDRLRVALRQLAGWELRLVLCALLTDVAPPDDYGDEHRSEAMLVADAVCGMVRRREP